MNAKRNFREGVSIRVCNIGHDDPMQFEVILQDASGEMQYQVTMSRTDFERLGGGNATPDTCVHAAFLFLLDREPKESILRRFDISVIESYFPEFGREFPRYRDDLPSLQRGGQRAMSRINREQENLSCRREKS